MPHVPAALLRRPTQRTVLRLALATLVANVVLVGTGGAVRLTGSGLGCPTWPRCDAGSLTPVPANGLNGFIEFGNRLLTYALAAVCIALVVAAMRRRPRRPDVVRLSWLLLAGIPAQAVIGGITVLTKLNPWTVMLHFLASMVLVGLSTVLVQRTREGDRAPQPVVPPLLRRLAVGVLGVVAVVLYLGTVVTGSGPHAGDLKAKRTGLAPASVSQLHADAVWLLVGLSVALLVSLAVVQAPRHVRRAAGWLVGVELAQGVIGYVQYFTGLPTQLVELHVVGASLVLVAGVGLVLSLRDRGPVGCVPPDAPVADRRTTVHTTAASPVVDAAAAAVVDVSAADVDPVRLPTPR